jgi:hypothetical protein
MVWNKMQEWQRFAFSVWFSYFLTCLLTLILLMLRIGWAPNSIPIYIQKDAKLHSLFMSVNCSTCFGFTSTHHQERIQLYLQHLVFVTPLLLPAAILDELEPVWVCCEWRTPPTAHSTTAAGSSNGVTNSRCCRYSFMPSWWWVEVPPETCRAVSIYK